MTVFLRKENSKGKKTIDKEAKVAENYYVNFSLVNDQKTKEAVEKELKEFIKSKKEAVKKAKKLTDKKYTLLSDKRLHKHLKEATKEAETFDKKCEIINDILKRFAGYGMLLNSFDYFNVLADINTKVAKENLKTLDSLKFDKEAVTIDDMFKDLKIDLNSDDD